MRKFGLIGLPLTHSFSPDYFKTKFESLNVQDAIYEAYPLPNLNDFRVWFKDQELLGINVTAPYKVDIIPFLDQLDPVAAEVNSVNCIALENDQLVGYNTDVEGFARSIVPFVENKFDRALIIGTGGASKAAAHALQRWGMSVFFLTRTPNASNHLSYDALSDQNIGFFPLIINCSPIGTHPNIQECPDLPYHALTASHFLYDMVYNPAQSLFLKQGQLRGAHTMNGLKMLQIQADLSWDIWNKKK